MLKKNPNLEIINKSKSRLPSLPFDIIKTSVLGEVYTLSLVFTTPKEIRILNKNYRKIDKVTDILSFPLSKNSGEIIICPTEAKNERLKFERSYKNFLAFLFIHGLVHLKGYDHGSKMEKEEIRFRKKFNI